MKKLLLALICVLTLATGNQGYSAGDSNSLPAVSFRDLVIYNHFDMADANRRTIGLEVEMVGLEAKQVVQLLIAELGGEDGGVGVYENEEAFFVKNTIIGNIRIEPVNFTRLLNRKRQTSNTQNPNQMVTNAVKKVDDFFGQLEVVTQPLNREQVKKFAKAMDVLGLAGAKGSSNLGRFVSIQPNIGIDHTNTQLIRSILANYYRNKRAIRRDIRPILMRYQFLASANDNFIQKLNDPNWNPSITELFDAYEEGSASKLSRIQLFNALISNAENYDRFEQPKIGKQRPQRPVAELREANTVFSDEEDPTKSSRHIMREVDFALAIVSASETTGAIDHEMEEKLFFQNLEAKKVAEVTSDEIPSLRSILRPKNFIPLKVRAVSDAEVLFANPELAAAFGIEGTPDVVAAKIKAAYAVEVDNSTSNIGERDESPTAPYATAHNDGAGGVGDGRALIFDDVDGHALSIKGSGLTPYQIKDYASQLGLHTGGTDGKMSFKEGVRTWIKGEVLHSLGINSERAISIIDNKGLSSKKGETQASAELLRQLPGGGIRNSHINHWDENQTRDGLEYLKAVASQETGRKFTDSTFVVFDAVKTGELAARMQDFLMIHGALAKGNVLAYPGLVDISGISFLSSPDPEFASFAYLSRFGNQANTLKRLLHDRKMAYAKTSKRLLQIDEQKIFEDSFNKEIATLAIMRLGFNRTQAEDIFSRNEAKAIAYGQHVWKYQFGRLDTDVDVFQSLIPSMYKELSSLKLNANQAAKQILEMSDGSLRERLVSRRNSIAVAKNRLQGNYSAMKIQESKDLLKQGLSLLTDGLSLPGVSVDGLISSAKIRESMIEGIDKSIDQHVDELTAAKEKNLDVKPAFESTQKFLSEFDARFQKSLGKVSAQGNQCIDLFK